MAKMTEAEFVARIKGIVEKSYNDNHRDHASLGDALVWASCLHEGDQFLEQADRQGYAWLFKSGIRATTPENWHEHFVECYETCEDEDDLAYVIREVISTWED